jgi:hypothetical protein
MKVAWTFIVLFVALISSTQAVSPLLEISARSPLAFDIHSERLPGGEFKFTVKISGKALALRAPFSAALAEVRITESTSRMEPIRALPLEEQGEATLCVFTVTEKELQDPNVSFYFSMPVPGRPATNHFYARLNNFLPRQ